MYRLLAQRAGRWLALGGLLFPFLNGNAGPTVLITNLPPHGSTENLAGLVLGGDPQACRIAVFIFVEGYGWVTKPTCSQPLTTIGSDGSWSADITTGGSDSQATRVAALLVSTNFSQPCVQGGPFLTNAFNEALASSVVTRIHPGKRWIRFSGYDWWVKTSTGRVGPGPNYFSDSTNNVWVDEQGQLHLRITNRSSQWQCAEIVSARTFGWGSYRFELNSRADLVNQSAVLGLFTWSDDPAYTHREIDVEVSRWNNPGDPNNSQFVVQPWDSVNHLVRYMVPAGLTNTTHLFTWETNRVWFQAQRGPFSPNPASSNVIRTWTYTAFMPRTGDENVRLNLWLNNGTPPTDNHEVEVIVKSFTFAPLSAPAPAELSNYSLLPDKRIRFEVTTEPDRRYVIQQASDSGVWQDVTSFLATNTWVPFSEPNAPHPTRRLFRAVTLP